MTNYISCVVCNELVKRYATIEDICITCYNVDEGENIVESNFGV